MITLIGKDLAKKELDFIFYGPAEECKSCRFKSSCVDSLDEGRKYRITDVRDNEQKCPIHDGNRVVPVEVERAPINLLTPSRNVFEGSTFQYTPIDCDEDCEFKEYCIPEGLMENDKCIIIESNGKHREKCKKGYRLNNITLAFVI